MNPANLFDPPFTILRPERPSAAAVLNSPHSGSEYPRAFLSNTKLQATAFSFNSALRLNSTGDLSPP